MTITIVGAGMAGLLAANMLQRHSPRIIEAQPSLPNNHSAVLRFGSDKVAEVTGIPFQKVKMIKGTLPWRNPVADALSYALKCGGVSRSDRSIPLGLERAERWIAPVNLISRMSDAIPTGKIKFEQPFDIITYSGDGPYISTIPMPALMALLGYPNQPAFNYVEGANLHFTVPNCEAYASLYIPSPAYRFNRLSVTGDEVIAEFAFPHPFPKLSAPEVKSMAFPICDMLGLQHVTVENVSYTSQRYAKIQPIDDIARKKFLAWTTDNHNIFSLGRFATWRPGLLLDDLVHDVRQIEKWINDRYAMKFAR